MPILNNLKIIIPLASKDLDFEKEFNTLKSLTPIGKNSMIKFFVDNFKLDAEYIFLCREKDLIDSNLLIELQSLKVKKKIIGIPKDTSSSIETVFYAEKYVKNHDKILIAHPDGINFYKKKEFHKFLKTSNADGFVCAFNEDSQSNTSETHTGRISVKRKKILRVIEKSIRTKDTMRLAGIYYFRRFDEYLRYAKKTLSDQLPVRGRHFISQIFNEYIKSRKKIKIFKFEKHIGLGLISYVKEYNFWFKYFKNKDNKKKEKFNFVNIIPACGDGERFTRENKNSFKPLIKLSNNDMVTTAIKSLPISKKNVVIIRKDHNKKYQFKEKIQKNNKNTEVLVLNKKTSGMASTCYEYLKNMKRNEQLLISSCDYDIVYDSKKLRKIINFFSPDVLIWTFKNYPDARISPFAYAYCIVENGKVTGISEKKPISDMPHKDHIAQGVFYFKSKKIFMEAYRNMINEKNKINNEYYVGNSINDLIKKGYKILPFEVDQYICLGTPQDLKVYNFWKAYFND